MTLTEFLLARITEDEAAAREATTPNGGSIYADRNMLGTKLLTHIKRRNPARVLAECEAKRRIVESLVDAEDAVTKYDSDDPNNPPAYWQEWGNLHALRLAAELLALPYADHPDYREEWRP